MCSVLRYSCEICKFSGKFDGRVYFLKRYTGVTGKHPVCKQIEAKDLKLYLFKTDYFFTLCDLIF